MRTIKAIAQFIRIRHVVRSTGWVDVDDRGHPVNTRPMVKAPQPCAGGECSLWDPRGDRPVPRFCARHCPDCNSALRDCYTHRPITADELGRAILAGAGRHRLPSQFSSLADD